MSRFQSTDSAEDMNNVGLAGLPADILDLLGTDCLDSDDFFNMRLTCRSIEAKTFNAFGRRYFQHVKFMLSPRSLTALEKISESEFAGFIRHLGFGLERLHSDKDRTFHDLARVNERWLEKYEQAYANELRWQEALERSQKDLAILVKVFKTLPNLKTVGVGGRNVKSRALDRIWDSENMQSWGTEQMLRRLGAADDDWTLVRQSCVVRQRSDTKTPQRTKVLYDEQKRNRTYRIVFQALQEVADRDLNLDIYVPPFWPAEQAIPLPLADSDTQKALSRTCALRLDLSNAYNDDDETKLILDTWVDEICRQVKSAISIQVSKPSGQYNIQSFLFKPLAGGGYTQLKTLKLEGVHTELQLLLEVLRKLSPTIEAIYFTYFYITKGGYDSNMMSEESYGRHGKWPDVYKVLQDLPKLKTLSLADLTEYRGQYREEAERARREITDAQSSPKYRRVWRNSFGAYGHQNIVDELEYAIKDNEEMINRDGSVYIGHKKFRLFHTRKPRPFSWSD
ncbi:hypothetical protein BU16DRAFT_540297 [Lophium mytilinum]|uniref:Uncharacterized protein n=1 Tax=Lophium mytilinum TaxID=390894 RepID=A0A6A6QNP3_9PEZI|nr:hypothetical protein BU16DRAFT_540297 [Lophium mytilinum]